MCRIALRRDSIQEEQPLREAGSTSKGPFQTPEEKGNGKERCCIGEDLRFDLNLGREYTCMHIALKLKGLLGVDFFGQPFLG